MDWIQTLTIIGSISAIVIWAVTRMDNSINKLDGDIKSLGNRLDGHAQRIDQLYRMFIDLVKEKQ